MKKIKFERLGFFFFFFECDPVAKRTLRDEMCVSVRSVAVGAEVARNVSNLPRWPRRS